MAYYKKDQERIKRFSKWLRGTALSKGFESQRQLAIIANINESTISRIWNGRQLPDEITVHKIAAALGLNASDVMIAAEYVKSGMDETPDVLVLPKLADPAIQLPGSVSRSIGDAERETIRPSEPIELTEVLKIENDLTYMETALTQDDIITIRHMIEMALRPRLPKIIPIYPPRPPIDYSIIPRIEDIDPDQIPLPNEFMFRDQRINRNQILMAEGRRPNDDDWKELIKNYKYNPPE